MDAIVYGFHHETPVLRVFRASVRLFDLLGEGLEET